MIKDLHPALVIHNILKKLGKLTDGSVIVYNVTDMTCSKC